MADDTQVLLAIPSPAPKVRPEEIERVLAILAKSGKWMTALEIAQEHGLTYRKVRAIAAAAGDRILSFPGSPGYRLFRQATIEEVSRAIDATEHQAHEMMRRSIAWRRAYHSRRVAA